LARPFIGSGTGVVLANISSEAGKAAYSMPFIKGAFDLADNLPGYRIVYMALLDFATCIGAVLAMIALGGMTILFDEIGAMQIFYFISAFVVLFIMAHRLPALRIYR
jgi:hypothetical protein